MSTTTTNLGLIKWSSGTDHFSNTQLDANWDIVDTIPDNIRKIRILGSLPDGTDPSEPLFQGRLVMLNTGAGGFPAWTLCRYNGTTWGAVGPVELQPSIPVTNLFNGRIVVLSATTGGFNAWSAIVYNGTAWQLINTSSVANARVYRSTNQTLNSGSATAISFDTVRYDTGSPIFWRVGVPTRLTAPTTTTYIIHGHVSFASDATGYRLLQLRLNGSLVIAEQTINAITGTNSSLSIATGYALTAGDYLELIAKHTSSGTLDVVFSSNYSPELVMRGV